MRKTMGLALAGLALILSACGKDAKVDAAEDVRALLVAAEAGDSEAFEAGIDREKLKADLRVQVREAAREQGIDIGGPSDAALDRMIGPDALRVARSGPAAATPTAAEIAETLEVQDKTRACLRAPGAEDGCALTFEKQGERWKLIGVQTSRLVPRPGETG
ncbi:hypothetical protein [Phenylobacterium sp.]|jgi:hypothetical protein|uniref:hypothetical protein n=1 Tax=Phenylobacterium sp. TaxID=1871053 RepID=UPI002E2F4D9B|nr:hypothetical protein [Phenylobacterium sp.]HEX2559728.1 hypothetical protein [Phenylobacterium sp.]